MGNKDDGPTKHYGSSNEKDLLDDSRWNRISRQLVLWVSYSSSGYFSMSPANQKKELNTSSGKDIYNGIDQFIRWGLFERTNKDGAFKRAILADETTLQYFHRATTKVNTKLALVWKLRRLLAKTGCAEHSNQQFADELGRDVSWISRYLKEIVAEGLVNRYGGNGGGQPMYYCNPGDKGLNQELLNRYGEHEEDDPRRESLQLKAQARAAQAQIPAKSIERNMHRDPYGLYPITRPKRRIVPMKTEC